MVTIINYDAGNIKSIQNMLKRIGVDSVITDDSVEIDSAEKLILPGVGHFGHGMRNLHQSGLVETLNKRVLQDKIPILGICLGAQLLGQGSEEASEKGLGWLEMEVVKFDSTRMDDQLKIPHMGWNELSMKKESALTDGLEASSRFYFVHSYHMKSTVKQDVLATVEYGYEFDAAVEKDNIYGAQFHPEKSHKFGMKILENFAKL